MEGRAADERDDGRRGSAAAGSFSASATSRRRRRRHGGSARSSATTARGRTSTAAPATSRRRSRPMSRSGSRATRPARRTCAEPPTGARANGGLEHARVFTRLWLSLFGLWSWERRAGRAARGDLPAAVGAAEHLRLRLLGAADDRRRSPSCRAHRPVRPLPFGVDELLQRRADEALPPAHLGVGASSRSTGCCSSTCSGRCGRCRRSRWRRAVRWIVDAPGGGRLLGRDPAALGLLVDRLAAAGLRRRRPGRCARGSRGSRASWSTRATSAGWRPASRRCGTPALALVALARRRASRRTHPAIERGATLAARRGGDGPRRLGGPPARPGRRRLGVRVRERLATPTSTTRPRSCSRCAGSARPGRGGRGRRARGALDRSAWRRRTAHGARSTPTTSAGSSASCRSATSAR